MEETIRVPRQCGTRPVKSGHKTYYIPVRHILLKLLSGHPTGLILVANDFIIIHNYQSIMSIPRLRIHVIIFHKIANHQHLLVSSCLIIWGVIHYSLYSISLPPNSDVAVSFQTLNHTCYSAHKSKECDTHLYAASACLRHCQEEGIFINTTPLNFSLYSLYILAIKIFV